MDDQQFLEFSIEANKLIPAAKNLLQLHLLRYSHFVANSPQGTNCTYARITKREFGQPDEILNTRTQLEAIRDQCEWLLSHLEQHETPTDQNPGQ